ncbi:ATP-binding protein, partial [bacterium]|nr:ATP-binding protein [bacterium]
LLANAIRFTENGAIRVAARLDGDQAVVSVSDDGVGIDTTDLARIFEPFSQVDRREGSGPRGVGLGLAVAKRLMELQGASISAASEVGRGTTMVASWPVAPSAK